MSARRWSATALVRKLQDVHWAVGGCRCLVTHALAIWSPEGREEHRYAETFDVKEVTSR